MGSMALTGGLAIGEVILDLACKYGFVLLVLGYAGYVAFNVYKWYQTLWVEGKPNEWVVIIRDGKV